MEKIRSLTLPADPPSYELWYTYAIGRNPPLNRRINDALDASRRLSVPELDGIYDEFVGSAKTVSHLEHIGKNISDEIDKVVGMLGELILSTSESHGDCDQASRQLEESCDQHAVRAISDALIKSLRAVGLKYTALEQRLNTSKQEVESLQQALSTMTVEASLDPVTGSIQSTVFRRRSRPGDRAGQPG